MAPPGHVREARRASRRSGRVRVAPVRGRPVHVRRYEPADKAAVLELLQTAFGVWPHGLHGVDPEEFFTWKLERCPFGQHASFVAESAAGTVGFVAQLPWQLQFQGRQVSSLRGLDIAVRPAERGRGISKLLIRTVIQSTPAEVALTWNNPNEQSRPGLLKTGRRQVVLLPRLLAPPLRAPALARTLARTMAGGSGTPAALLDRAETAGEVLADGDYLAQVLEGRAAAPDRLMTARSAEYLRWRYGNFPEYRAFRADPGTPAPGIVIYRHRRRRSLWLAEVCELLCPGGELRTARHLLAKVRNAAQDDVLGAGWLPHPARSGFVRTRSSLLLTTRRLDPDLPDLRRPRSWGLSFGDIELL